MSQIPKSRDICLGLSAGVDFSSASKPGATFQALCYYAYSVINTESVVSHSVSLFAAVMRYKIDEIIVSCMPHGPQFHEDNTTKHKFGSFHSQME